ncbi:hypothetical protein D3C80_1684420 [compost metagenome]
MVVAAVAIGVKAIVLLTGQRQTQIAILPTHALARIEVVDATLAAGDLDSSSMAVDRVARDDVDHRHQRIGAITDRVRAAENFDAFDVLHGHRNIAPVHRGQPRAVYRAAVNQYLHAPRIGGAGAVVVHRRLIAADMADHHARYQA